MQSSSNPAFFKPVASWRHFGIVIAIMLVVAVQGIVLQSKQSVSRASSNHIVIYVSLIIVEWALVYLVWRGIRKTHTTLRDLVGGRWESPRDVVRDFALGILLWVVLISIATAWKYAAGGGGLSESVTAALPRSGAERMLWVLVSISAGFAEEIVFRGYVQRQLEALTRSRWTALGLQALLFGVTHGYQGADAMVRISVLGLAFGLMAVWRQSLRPGIIAHSWTDMASGLFFMR
jgi:membrane protease YdiL (CAAX protease family)